jgi:Ala-tRNA(Pro) deacylase
MSIPKKISNLLDKEKIKYKEIEHRKVFTGIDKAKTLRIKEKDVAKTVALRSGRQYFIVTIPADTIIDLRKIKKILPLEKVKEVSFAKEKWIKDNLKGAKTGSIPPFGFLWKLPSIIDSSVFRNKKTVFNSGNHFCSIEIESAELKKIMKEMIKDSFTKKKPVRRKSVKKRRGV